MEPLALAPRRRASFSSAGFPLAYLTIETAERIPVTDAIVRVCIGGRLAVSARTSRQGVVTIEDDLRGDAKVVVVAPSWAPQVHGMYLYSGNNPIRLRPGATVSGRVRVNGESLTSAMELMLSSSHAIQLDFRGTGMSVEEMGISPEALTSLSGVTNESGEFAFRGLPSDWEGALVVPRAYHLVDRATAVDRWSLNELKLRGPVERLLVDLERVCLLRGRVVGEDGGSILGAEIRPVIQYEGERVIEAREYADADGRFVVELRNGEVLGGVLTLSSPDGRTVTEVRLEAMSPLSGDCSRDLGDLVLGRGGGAGVLHLLVHDLEGRPVEGAVGIVLAGATRASRPTDQTGRTTVAGVVAGESLVHIGALGFAPREIVVPLEADEEGFEYAVSLVRSSKLELRVFESDGRPAHRLTAVLSASESLHPWRGNVGAELAALRAGESAGIPVQLRTRNMSDDGRVSDAEAIRVNFGASNQIVLSDLRPGLPMRLQVMGRYGGLAKEVLIAPLGREEQRRLRIELDQPSKAFAGRVLDEQGRPLLDARILVQYGGPDREGGGSSHARGVDQNGRFSISGVYSEHLDVTIQCPDYVLARYREFEVPLDGGESQFVLAHGRDVKVVVEDAAGTRLSAQVRVNLEAGALVQGERVGNGEYLLRGLPDAEVKVLIRVGEDSLERMHDTRLATLRVTVP